MRRRPGRRTKRGQGDLPTQEEHGRQDDEDGDEVAHHVGQKVREGLLSADHVVVQPADQRAGLGPGEKSQRHALDVPEDLGSHVEDEALADIGGDATLNQHQGCIDNGQAADHDRQDDHQAAVLVQDPIVDEVLEDEGVDGGKGRIQHDRGQEDGEHLAIRDGEGQHAPGRSLFHPVLEDGPVLSQGAHAAPPARPSSSASAHGVSPHIHRYGLCDLE